MYPESTGCAFGKDESDLREGEPESLVDLVVIVDRADRADRAEETTEGVDLMETELEPVAAFEEGIERMEAEPEPISFAVLVEAVEAVEAVDLEVYDERTDGAADAVDLIETALDPTSFAVLEEAVDLDEYDERTEAPDPTTVDETDLTEGALDAEYCEELFDEPDLMDTPESIDFGISGEALDFEEDTVRIEAAPEPTN